MSANLAKHPTLRDDPQALYNMSVPPQVLQSRAAQAALKKIENKQGAAKVSGGSGTARAKTEGVPESFGSLQEAVSWAESQEHVRALRSS